MLKIVVTWDNVFSESPKPSGDLGVGCHLCRQPSASYIVLNYKIVRSFEESVWGIKWQTLKIFRVILHAHHYNACQKCTCTSPSCVYLLIWYFTQIVSRPRPSRIDLIPDLTGRIKYSKESSTTRGGFGEVCMGTLRPNGEKVSHDRCLNFLGTSLMHFYFRWR